MEDLSDNEREELLRNAIRDNWLWVVGGIGLGLALLGGWQYYKRSTIGGAEAAQARYVQGLEALGRNDRDRATALLGELRSARGTLPYADQLELALARAAMDKRDFDAAAKHLRVVMDGANDQELAQIARIRLARVVLDQGKNDEALALLDVANAGAFAPLYHDVRGDAFAAKGDVNAAAKEYDAALAADVDATRLDRAYVELKRHSLPAAQVASVPTAVPTPTAATEQPQ